MIIQLATCPDFNPRALDDLGRVGNLMAAEHFEKIAGVHCGLPTGRVGSHLLENIAAPGALTTGR